jgi:circadian clock protein KaiC
LGIARIESFVPGLDRLMQGGFPQGHVILVAGTPGSGKSILCSQILFHNAMKGKRCLYLNLEQNEKSVEAQMVQLGWDPKKPQGLRILSLDADDPNVVNFLLSELATSKYDLVCVDSLDAITSTLPSSTLSFRGEPAIPTSGVDPANLTRLRIKTIFKALGQSNATVFLTSERIENQLGLTRDTVSEFLSDGILLLKIGAVGTAVRRTLSILKMRQTKIDLVSHVFEISETGIQVD